MGRSNVIIVGSIVLAPLILGVESYALYHAHHRRAPTAASAELTETRTVPAPDEQRAATRAIDGAYARTVQAIAQLPPGADLRSAGLDRNADQARREASNTT